LRNAGVEFDAVDYAKKPLDEATVKSIVKAYVKDVNVLRRPIYIAGKNFIVGFDKAAYSKLK
jgi:arsenate reductase-like glutaredoxin family protein